MSLKQSALKLVFRAIHLVTPGRDDVTICKEGNANLLRLNTRFARKWFNDRQSYKVFRKMVILSEPELEQFLKTVEDEGNANVRGWVSGYDRVSRHSLVIDYADSAHRYRTWRDGSAWPA